MSVTLLYGCTQSSNNLENTDLQQSNANSTINKDDATDISDFTKHPSISALMLVLGFFDEKNNLYTKSSINIGNSKDFKFVLETSCGVNPIPKEDIDLAITAYIDYKQVEFSVGNDTSKINRYIYKSKSDDHNKLTLTIPTSSLAGTHKLTIVSQCTKYVGEGIGDSICRSVDLNIGNETSYDPNDKKSSGKDITYPGAVDQNTLIINRKFIPETEKSNGIERSSFVIKAKKNENISLALRFPQAATDGILFLTLNSNQIPIDGEQYLYFKDMKNPMFKKITIKTPDTPGEYYLTGYFVHAPWEKTSDLTAISESTKLIIE
jgi:hypothetical protein